MQATLRGDYDVPAFATVDTIHPEHAIHQTSAATLRPNRSSQTKGRYGVNLPAVAEVLAEYGVDPAVELALIVRKSHDDGGLPTQDRARVLSELLQYVRPKLKATEVTIKPPDLTPEQLDRRLESLLARRPVVTVV